jgi:hypothetical protein
VPRSCRAKVDRNYLPEDLFKPPLVYIYPYLSKAKHFLFYSLLYTLPLSSYNPSHFLRF